MPVHGLALALVLLAPASGEAEVTGSRFGALRSAARGDERADTAWVERRDVRVRATSAGLRVLARWRVRATSPRMFAGQLFGPGVIPLSTTWGGRVAASWSLPGGTFVVGRVDGEIEIVAEALVPGDPSAGRELELMAAAKGEVTIDSELGELELRAPAGEPVVRVGKRHWTGARRLALAPVAAKGDETGTLVVAEVGLGITVAESEIRGRARVRWSLRRGEIDAIALRVAGLADDLVVEGANVAKWERSGDRISIALKGRVTTTVDVDLRWSSTTPRTDEARLTLPTIEPLEVFRSSWTVQLARDGDIDFQPELERWVPIATAELPAVAHGLVEGTPTGSFRDAAAPVEQGALALYRFEPVSGPPLVVDVADYAIATSEEGRVLMRARFELSNERASHLQVTPPAGTRLIGAEVGGEIVRPGRKGTSWRIPLKRSIETVDGLVAVPVVIALIGEGERWRRSERRELGLPSLDAPVSVTRVSLVLPRRYRSRLEAGDADVVASFSRGNEVGYALESDEEQAVADDVFADAVDAWNTSDFRRAQEKLDELERMGAGTGNTGKLQGNVDLVRPREVDGKRPVLAADEVRASAPKAAESVEVVQRKRRVREQAKARAGRLVVEHRSRKAKAKEMRDKGDYAGASAEYKAALEVGRTLEGLEQPEATDYDFANDEIEGELLEVEKESEQRAAMEQSSDMKIIAPRAFFRELEPGAEWGLGDAAFVDEPVPLTPPPRRDGPLVVVPRVGETVLYQLLLFEAGAVRSIEIDARRRLESH